MSAALSTMALAKVNGLCARNDNRYYTHCQQRDPIYFEHFSVLAPAPAARETGMAARSAGSTYVVLTRYALRVAKRSVRRRNLTARDQT